MNKTTFVPFLFVASAACGAAQMQAARPLPSELTSAGDTVYFGTVYPLAGASRSPEYVYERRVADQGGGLQIATHITRDPSGGVVLADSAVHGADYALADYTLHTDQLGRSGSIHVDGDRVRFLLRDANGGEHTDSEQITAPVVVGPTLIGHLVRHLDALRSGAVLEVRMAVLDRLETIGFELKAIEAAPGQTRIEMSPSSFLIAAVVDPIDFTFDTASSKLVRLEGRVPPKVRDGSSWADFDARVEYRFVAASYR